MGPTEIQNSGAQGAGGGEQSTAAEFDSALGAAQGAGGTDSETDSMFEEMIKMIVNVIKEMLEGEGEGESGGGGA